MPTWEWTSEQGKELACAKEAALEVLLHNSHGPFHGLPRTAGWGYPEPYTRDLMLSLLGIATSGNPQLLADSRNVLETLATNQSTRGHIPSLVHDPEDRGASDTTPLFLLGVGIYRAAVGEPRFLEAAVAKALVWLEYQSPSDRFLVAQQPTSDWRDEQWVMGYGLYVNVLLYSALRLLGQHDRAEGLRLAMKRFTFTSGRPPLHVHEETVSNHKPYYAFWVYKIYHSDRFDLLGNSLALLSGLASPSRSAQIVTWVEAQCDELRHTGDLVGELPPNFFPYIRPGEPDWLPRYQRFNKPGEYHNGGIWPFVGGFYVAALVAAGKMPLARKKLLALAGAARLTRVATAGFGFNEWIKAQTGEPLGQDWQSWSAASFLYASACVETEVTPFFNFIRA